MAGRAKVSRRSPVLMSDGQVLPSAWNMLEQVKTIPIATKFHEMICRN